MRILGLLPSGASSLTGARLRDDPPTGAVTASWPDLLPFAEYLTSRFGCVRVVALRTAEVADRLAPETLEDAVLVCAG